MLVLWTVLAHAAECIAHIQHGWGARIGLRNSLKVRYYSAANSTPVLSLDWFQGVPAGQLTILNDTVHERPPGQ